MARPAISFFVLAIAQQGFQIRERVVGRAAADRVARAAAPILGQRLFAALMFVVVAVEAQQFPVAAVRRVVVVVVVAVVYRQLVQVLAVELARAAPADPWIKLQRLLAVIALALFPATPGGGHDLVQLAAAGGRGSGFHRSFLERRVNAQARIGWVQLPGP